MKRTVSLLISFFLAFSVILPVQAAGSADYAFEITVSDTSPEVGDTVKVKLTLKSTNDEAFNVCAMQNYVNFDTESFEYVEDSLDCADEFTATAQNGRVFVNCYGKDMDVESGSLQVISFELKVLKAGDSSITSSGTEFFDEDLTRYDFDTVDAEVEAVAEGTGSGDADDDDDDEPSSPAPEVRYDIDIVGSSKGGDVDVSKTRAKKGTEITVFADPDEGYEIRYVRVLDEDGDEVRVREEDEGIYTFKMPESDVTVKVSFKKIDSDEVEDEDEDEETEEPEVTVDPPVHVCPSAAFTDVNTGLWYHDAVDFALENKLMNGVSDTLFVPNGTTTRAMLATVLWRMAGSPKSDAAMMFTDVKPGDWYYDAIKWAAASGVVNGMGDGLFAPNAAITREQLATMLYRYEKYNGGGFEAGWTYTLGFTDASSVSSWAYEALCWCHSNRIVNGMGDNMLLPLGNATRAQTAQMLMNYLNLE